MALVSSGIEVFHETCWIKGIFFPSPSLIFRYTALNLSKKNTFSEQQSIKSSLLRAPVRKVSHEVVEEEEVVTVTVLLGEKPFNNQTQE